MESMSSFSEIQWDFPDAELLPVSGATCLCYRVKLYGKLHFLKKLKPEFRTHPHYVSALQKEFELGYVLEHPHLVRYIAKSSDSILMDYIDGETLTQFVEHHPKYFYNRKNSDRFISQLLGAVGYLHNHQIVHLDLKPNNILITHIGHDVKLVDLGCCYTDCYPDTTGSTSEYAAPEQRNCSGKLDERTDIYAIGRILQTLPCAPYYKEVIKRCTARLMDIRYSSIEELKKALHHRRNTWPLFAISAIVITTFAVSLIYHQTRQKPTV